MTTLYLEDEPSFGIDVNELARRVDMDSLPWGVPTLLKQLAHDLESLKADVMTLEDKVSELAQDRDELLATVERLETAEFTRTHERKLADEALFVEESRR